ncbi:hypothetical protein JTE90_005869 [Oedothorax gibbosus]|uniref:Uncharacterized protein n=1 Tax=Oedothorax gibbosus TaxID=931172 RepID=A0AAV6UPG0_9ARAC|nr:hypothetical protein JTE90_005869 [Oedothorax gibbosus]
MKGFFGKTRFSVGTFDKRSHLQEQKYSIGYECATRNMKTSFLLGPAENGTFKLIPQNVMYKGSIKKCNPSHSMEHGILFRIRPKFSLAFRISNGSIV